MTIFNLLRGVFSAKVMETGAAFFEALFEQITEHVSRDNKAKADYDQMSGAMDALISSGAFS